MAENNKRNYGISAVQIRMETLANQVKLAIRDVPDFPKEGIIFKDITPILKDHTLCKVIVDEMANQVADLQLDAIACIESRGYWFGALLAQKLQLPFIPIRKAGKLPYKTVSHSYDLEYCLLYTSPSPRDRG